MVLSGGRGVFRHRLRALEINLFFMLKTKKIWLDGKFIDWSKAKVHVLTHALHYGSGVFEGIRAYQTKNGPAVFRLDDHLKRLYDSAKGLEMKIPFS